MAEATISESALAAAFVKALNVHQEQNNPREDKKPSLVSAYNPTGDPNKVQLARETVFCGAVQQAESLTATEIELFNRLKPGRYNGNKWQVKADDDGMGQTLIDVRLPISDINSLMDLPNSLVAILSQITAEAEARQPAAKTK